MRLVLLGAPGSGKGTQGGLIKSRHNVVHISTGDILRENVKNHTQLGLEAKKFMDAGQLVPDEVINNMLAGKLDEIGDASFMLDGFPRTFEQAQFLDEYLSKNSRPLSAVFYFAVPDQEIIARLSKRLTCKSCGKIFNGDFDSCPACGGEMYKRDDDNENTIRNRLAIFHVNNKSLLEYYAGKNILHEIAASGSPEEIFERVSVHLS